MAKERRVWHEDRRENQIEQRNKNRRDVVGTVDIRRWAVDRLETGVDCDERKNPT